MAAIVSSPDQGKKKWEGRRGERITCQKDSEYKLIEQLAKTPAQISLMSLLVNLDIHQEALFKALKEAKIKLL